MTDDAINELQQLVARKGGLLAPADVVAFARDENTALHSHFQWDDSKAAEAYRLWQARQVLRVAVVMSDETHEPVRAFVSLRSDREMGGYRVLAEVLTDGDLTQQLLSDARAELGTFRRKYEALRKLVELKPLFEQIDMLVPQKRAEEAPALTL